MAEENLQNIRKKSCRRIIIFVNIILLAFILIAISYILFSYVSGIFSEQQCLDLYSIISLRYDACYDSSASSIILLLTRGFDSYDIQSIDVTYVDSATEKVSITNVPEKNEIKKYNFSSSKNPGRIKIVPRADIPAENLCQEERVFLFRDCTSLNLSAAFSEQVHGKVNQTGGKGSAQISASLVSKNQTWKPDCISDWDCSFWETCQENIQARSCTDKNKCKIPINPPDFTRTCDNSCQEEWQCQWSMCENSYTVPSCHDVNNCGSALLKPGKIPCINENCIPDIICEPWEICRISLGLSEISGNIQELHGISSRLCMDRSNCASPEYESHECTIKADIYTKEISWQNEKYLEIYDKITDKLLSRIKYSEKNSVLNLNFYIE